MKELKGFPVLITRMYAKKKERNLPFLIIDQFIHLRLLRHFLKLNFNYLK